jgi:hypothetical protein
MAIRVASGIASGLAIVAGGGIAGRMDNPAAGGMAAV